MWPLKVKKTRHCMFHHPLIQGDFIFGVKGQYKVVKVKKKVSKITIVTFKSSYKQTWYWVQKILVKK